MPATRSRSRTRRGTAPREAGADLDDVDCVNVVGDVIDDGTDDARVMRTRRTTRASTSLKSRSPSPRSSTKATKKKRDGSATTRRRRERERVQKERGDASSNDGGSTEEDATGEARRFIKPAAVLQYLERDNRRRNRAPRGEKAGLFERAVRRVSSAILWYVLGMSPGHGLNVRRFYMWIYFMVALTLENYLMCRGVRVQGVAHVTLNDTQDPSLFLKGLYTRYLPLATIIDYVILIGFFRIDVHGRPMHDFEDAGILIRHVVKSVMRHPAVTLNIVGYKYSGHSFDPAQIVTLLVAPPLVAMALISAMERFKAELACCVLNFILYPTFYVGLDNIAPIYRGIRMHFSVKGWVVATLAPLALRYHLNAMSRVTAYLRGRLSLSLVATGLDAFAVRRGLLFKAWRRATDKYLLGKDTQKSDLSEFKMRSSSTLGISVQEVAHISKELHMSVQEMRAHMDGVRVAFKPKQTNRQKESMKRQLTEFAELFTDEVNASPSKSVDVDFSAQEVWLRGIELINTPNGEFAMFLKKLQSTSSNECVTQVDVFTRNQRDTFVRVQGPLKFMHVGTQSTQAVAPCIVGSSAVAVAVGSARAITFIGRRLNESDMTVRVGSGSTRPAMGGRPMKRLQAATRPRREARKMIDVELITNLNDADLHAVSERSDDFETYEVTISVLSTASRQLKEQGHFVFQASNETNGTSQVFPIIASSHVEMVTELNRHFGLRPIRSSERIFLLAVGHALAGEYSRDVVGRLIRVAYGQELTHLAAALMEFA